MKSKFILPWLTLAALSCKLRPTSTGPNPGENKTYHLRLKPQAGSDFFNP